MIETIPPAFSGIPKSNCHYSLVESFIQHQLQHHLLVLVLKPFDEKLQLCLLCTIVNTNSDEIVLPKNRHLDELKPLSNIDDPLRPLVVNEMTNAIDSNQVDT